MVRLALCALLGVLTAAAFAQVSAGQTDTFPTNVMNWQGAQPTWISTGGPAGAGDSFLRFHSVGGGGAGSHMAGNNAAQWSGNYTSAGVGAISVDLENLDQTELDMRLVFFDTGLGTQWDSNFIAVLPANSTWQHFVFTINASLFTQVEGTTSFADTISSAGRIMFRHDPGAPDNSGVSIVGTLGVDNVHAVPVPEPATFGVLGLGALLIGRRKR